MASFNKVILVGNLTRDPELRYLPKGTAVARLGLAVNRTWKTETGEKKEETAFIDIDAFGVQAETICQYMRKGSPMLVEGRLRLDQWDDKQTGQKRSKLGVVLEGFQFLGSATRPADGSGPSGPVARAATPPPQRQAPPASDEAPPAVEEDDVPF